MSKRMLEYEDGEELTRAVSLESYGDSNYTSNDDDSAGLLLSQQSSRQSDQPKTSFARYTTLIHWQRLRGRALRRLRRLGRRQSCLSIWLSRLYLFVCGFFCCLFAITVVVACFFPAYTKLPPDYQKLHDRINDGFKSGSANVHNEKVFIASSIFDPGGELARGDWANNVLKLIHLLGPDNVYLSIYENDSGSEALDALAALEARVPCNHTLIAEPHIPDEDLPHVTLYNGTKKVKRIAYLAEVRNRALRPLETAQIRFDKLLYLNDVMFRPVEAAQLLFSTNTQADGRADYRAACAVDFINPFKFYDTFATRDLDGFSMGVPFFPWFPAIGGDTTLDDVLSDSDAVRVRSCWGGMIAFDARFFQNWNNEAADISTAANEGPENITAPYRFRAKSDLWWDSSECCLINADIQSPNPRRPGIYMNPYVRVAYDSRTLSWLWLTRRFEKLYTPIHFIADLLVNLPEFNARRDEISWQTVEEAMWVDDGTGSGQGSFQKVTRTAKHDGFCGRRALPVMKENKDQLAPGERNWEFIPTPPIID